MCKRRKTVRVVSFVPSWTETLLWADVNVVGRTRFCIHPAGKVKSIPVVGGTKDMDRELLKSLGPDLVIFDREENNETMAADCPFSWLSTHVTSIHDMPRELTLLSEKLGAPKLHELALRWEKVLGKKNPSLKTPPGFIEWEKPPQNFSESRWVYVIWAHPWMAASGNTFIGSLCEHLGWPVWSGKDKYPVFAPKDFNSQDHQTSFMCSSEPYPFLKKREVLKELPGPTALVDGEKLSWFGLRSLLYMESAAEQA
jgi:hypothetical protein